HSHYYHNLTYLSCPHLPAYLFDFYCCRDPRDLPSFPTRRSSDLPLHARRRFVQGAFGRGEADETQSRPALHHLDAAAGGVFAARDRKSTRLNSSHVKISYAVFCLKKKNIF